MVRAGWWVSAMFWVGLAACGSTEPGAPDATAADLPQPPEDTSVDAVEPQDPIVVLQITPSDAIGVPTPPEARITDTWDSAFLAANTDGFSLQPLIRVVVSKGLVDVGTFTSEHVYLHPESDADQRIGIEQRVYDPETETLSFLPARYLAQATTYRLVVDGLKSHGQVVESASVAFTTGRFTDELTDLAASADDWDAAVTVVAESTSGLLAWTAHRATLHAGTPPVLPWPAWESGGGLLNEQSITAEAGGAPVTLAIGPSGMYEGPLPDGGGDVVIRQHFEMFVPTGIGRVVLGRYQSPWLLNDEQLLVHGPGESARQVWFTLWLPEGDPPDGGWPVVLYAHGYRSHRHHAPLLAGQLAQAGLATMAVTAVGHGGGPDGWIELDGEQYPDGGRGVDANHDGIYLLEEGMRSDPLGPSHGAIRGLTDGVRQSVIDYMAAIRAIEAGLPDVSTSANARSWFGISNGGRIGALLMAVDPKMPVAVLNVPPTESFSPLADTWRGLWSTIFAATAPPLTNGAHPQWGDFDEDIPFRGGPVQVGLSPGAAHIQAYLDRYRWATMPMNGAAYAGRYAVQGKRILVQIGRGDPVVVNPGTLDLVREGGLQATTCLFWPERSAWHDHLGVEAQPLVHVFAVIQPNGPNWHPGVIGVAAREQLAQWYLSRGEILHDPDPDAEAGLFGLGDVFEVPLSDAAFQELDSSFGYDPAQLYGP